MPPDAGTHDLDLQAARAEPRQDAGEEQRRLARTGGARDRDNGTRAHPLQHRLRVGFAPEEHVGVIRAEGPKTGIGAQRGDRKGGRRRGEVGVLAQHRQLEGREPRSGLDAKLVREPLPRGANHGERLGLPVGAVVRQRDDRPSILAQRLFAEQALGVRDEGAVLARRKPRVEELFLRARPDLVQAERLHDSGLPVRDILQRRAAPHCEGAQVGVDRTLVLPAQRVPACRRHETLEADGIDRVGVDGELVGPTDRFDALPAEP